MILKKIITATLLIGFFTGCVQNTAFLGPVYTLGTTGNTIQAGLSYGSSKVVTKVTGKTPQENLNKILQKNDNDSELRKLLKRQITSTRKKLKLTK